MPRRSSRRRRRSPEGGGGPLIRTIGGYFRRRIDTPWFFPVAALVLIAAMLAGVRLGNSAAAGIDRAAFRAPPPVRLADDGGLAPPRRAPAAADLFAPSYAGPDCGRDCPSYVEGTMYGAGGGGLPGASGEPPYFGSEEELRAAIAQARTELGPDFPETAPDGGVADGPVLRTGRDLEKVQAIGIDRLSVDQE